LLCIGTSGVVKWQLYDAAVNPNAFSAFLGSLPSGAKLVLDNAVIHCATEALRKQGLPTIPKNAESKKITSPHMQPLLNAVELSFEAIRTYMNQEHPRIREEIIAQIEKAVQTLTQAACDRYVRKVWSPQD